MGKKSTPKAPAAPDYAAAATAQGQANQDAARQSAELTNVNQYTPYGNQVFTKDPGSDQWSSTVTLSPEQQHLYDLQTQGDTALGETAVSQLGRVSDSMSQPLDLSGAPARVNSVGQSNYSLYNGQTPNYGQVGAGPQYSEIGSGPQYSSLGAGQQAGTVGSGPGYGKYTGDVMQMPDYAKQAQEVEDSLYRSATSRLDPQYAQREDAERSRLINSGVAEGSEQWNNSMDAFNRQKQADYGDARDRAIQGRGAEQSRLNNDFYTGNAQQFGQSLQSLGFNNDSDARAFADQLASTGFNNSAAATNNAEERARAGFNNDAATQGFTNQATAATLNNASRSQAYADALRGTEFNNNTQSQDYANQLQRLGFNNNAQSQQFNDALAAGNFQNTQRGAAIDEAAYLRNDPLNVYNSLMTGAQVTNPQFRGTGQVQGPAAAPTFAATQAQDQRAVDLYNAQLASSGSAQSGLMGIIGNLGGAAINQWSDRRLKSNIRRIGKLKNGLPLYSYSIFGRDEIGVMADEVRAVIPSAVTRHPSGYDQVDYSQLGVA